MENEELRKSLQQLQDVINNTQTVDDKGRDLLHDLDNDIRALLDRSEENLIQLHPSVIQRLEDTIYHFEVSHPSLTTVISRLLDSLSNAGI